MSPITSRAMTEDNSVPYSPAADGQLVDTESIRSDDQMNPPTRIIFNIVPSLASDLDCRRKMSVTY